MIPLIKIELTESDQLLFVKFQKHFSLVQALDSMGVFSIKSGSVTLNFDSFGQIRSIDKHEHFKIPDQSLA